jgi:type IV/VI secretion system ImpK/VasF family protein
MSEPSRDAMYQAAVATLAATVQLSEERGLPPTDVLREQMLRSLREFVARCREAAISDQEVAEARYALVAFIDDRVLKSSFAGSAEWGKNPLQLQFYREFTAGENFFGRLRALTQRGGPVFPLEAYYLCLALGFVGALPGATSADAARPFLDAARARLLSGHNVERIAPNAVPIERHRPPAKAFPLAAATAAACAVIGALALAGLHMSLGGILARAAVELTSADPAAVSR